MEIHKRTWKFVLAHLPLTRWIVLLVVVDEPFGKCDQHKPSHHVKVAQYEKVTNLNFNLGLT